MKKLILLLLLLPLSSCNGIFGVSDYAGAVESIIDAKEFELLKNVYIPSKNIIIINSEEYEIKQAWTSYRFKTRNSDKINRDVYDFLVIIKNTKTKEFGLSSKTTSGYSDYIKFYCKECISQGGIETDKLCIQFNSKKTPKSPDSIRIGFISRHKEDIIVFKKQ